MSEGYILGRFGCKLVDYVADHEIPAMGKMSWKERLDMLRRGELKQMIIRCLVGIGTYKVDYMDFIVTGGKIPQVIQYLCETNMMAGLRCTVECVNYFQDNPVIYEEMRRKWELWCT